MEDKVIKILVAGEGGVGKSTMIQHLLTGSYRPQSLTVGLSVETWKWDSGAGVHRVTIMDVGGEERFQFLLPTWAKGAQGSILAFDLSRFETYLHLEDWLHLLVELIPRDLVLLVGTKTDVGIDREVLEENGHGFAEEHGLLGYIETSSVTGECIMDAFLRLLGAVRRRTE